MKKIFALCAFGVLYLGGGAWLQSCMPTPFEQGFFMIERLDFKVSELDKDTLRTNTFYHRDSLVINTRLRQIYYIQSAQNASLWTPLPTSYATSPVDPLSKQVITQFNVTLLDSLQLLNGNWLLPQSNVNAYFEVLQTYSTYPRADNIGQFLMQQPRFESPYSHLRMRWTAALAMPSSLRLSVELKLDDGQFFSTPANEPLLMQLR